MEISWTDRVRSEEAYSNIYLTRCSVTRFIISGNCSAFFGWYLHPSSGAHTTVFTASGICRTVTSTCRYRGGFGTCCCYILLDIYWNIFTMDEPI